MVPTVILWVALGAILVVPAAAAQDGQGRWHPPPESEPFAPETDAATVALTFEYACRHESWGPLGPIEASYAITSHPAFATVVLTPQTESRSADPEACAASASPVEFEVELVVTTSREAPAFEPWNITVEASVVYGQGPTGGQDGPFAVEVPLAVSYFPLMHAVPKQTLIKAAPNAQASWHVDVTNFGNGPTRVSTTVEQTSEGQGLAALVPPPPFILGSDATDGPTAKTQKTVQVVARTPGEDLYQNRIITVRAEFLAEHAQNPSNATDADVVVLSIQVQGVAPTPGPSVAALVLGVAAVATGLARRRRQ